ncbi:MAG: formate dehydrogenase accessory sulfurtransferase FdhD [Candidatus Eisenbacteria bacterium]
MREAHHSFPVIHVTPGGAREARDNVAEELPLDIHVGERFFASVMRTPGDEVELAVGLLFAAGMLLRREDAAVVEHRRDFNPEQVRLRLVSSEWNAVVAAARYRTEGTGIRWQGAYGGSGSAETMDRVAAVIESLRGRCSNPATVPASRLTSMLERMIARQVLRHATLGTHAMALFDYQGDLLAFAEDVGRHNALDKVIGRAVLQDRLADCQVCIASSRAAFDVVRKAAVAGIPILATVSAPTAPAIELARQAGMTLVGCLREDSLRIYAGAQRVVRGV